jgi:membrane-bound acyltransferase YfiQ involved in biofilm formation
MNEKDLNKFIGYAITAIFASYILQMMVPFLVWCVIGAFAWQIYLANNKRK